MAPLDQKSAKMHALEKIPYPQLPNHWDFYPVKERLKFIYHKNLKIQTPKIFIEIFIKWDCLDLLQCNYASKRCTEMANSVDPDQTAPKGAV